MDAQLVLGMIAGGILLLILLGFILWKFQKAFCKSLEEILLSLTLEQALEIGKLLPPEEVAHEDLQAVIDRLDKINSAMRAQECVHYDVVTLEYITRTMYLQTAPVRLLVDKFSFTENEAHALLSILAYNELIDGYTIVQEVM